MAAENNEYLMEATQTLYTLNSDEMIRRQCQARYDAERQEFLMQKKIETLSAMIADKDAEIADKDAMIASLRAQIASSEK